MQNNQYCAVYSVLVVQLSHDGQENSFFGNPMMIFVPQFLNKFNFSTICNPIESGFNYHNYDETILST